MSEAAKQKRKKRKMKRREKREGDDTHLHARSNPAPLLLLTGMRLDKFKGLSVAAHSSESAFRELELRLVGTGVCAEIASRAAALIRLLSGE